MKLQINDIIEVKFKSIPDVCHYYVCESDELNKLNASLPYALISLDKGKVELCFHSLDFKEVEYYLNHCDNSNYFSNHTNTDYGIESIGICHKGDYKLVYATKYTKVHFSDPKKHTTSEDKETKKHNTSEDKETEQILNQMNKYHKIRKRKPKEHKNIVDELIDRFGRY